MENLAALIVLVGIALFFIGLIGIIRPGLLRLSKRRMAALIWSSWLPLFALAMALDPTVPSSQSGDASLTEVAVALLILWAIGVGLIGLCARAKDRRVAGGSGRPAPSGHGDLPDPDKPLNVAKMANAMHTAHRAVAAEVRRAFQERPPEPVSKDELVRQEKAALARIAKKQAAAKHNSRRYDRPSDEILENERDNDIFSSSGDAGRLGRILRRGENGQRLSFEYADAYGEISQRTIINWVEFPRYVEGICTSARAIRCFRKDRVLEWYDNSHSLLRAPKGRAQD